MTYQPPQELLDRYAHLLIDFALGGEREGISPGDTVLLLGREAVKPMVGALARAIWRSGGHLLLEYSPDETADFNLTRDRQEHAPAEELDYFPEAFYRGRADTIDHYVWIIGDREPEANAGLDESKLMRAAAARAPLMTMLREKESAGKLTWAPAFYGTEAMAAAAGLSHEEYWEQIIAGCLLDGPDPVARWREAFATMKATRLALTELAIDRIHMEGPDVDLHITVGADRRFYASEGINIPSFEVFTCPDWRGTEGWMRFSEPCYNLGPVIEGIELEFKDGVVIRASATKNEKLLQELIAADANANKLGEFSLTDSRVSKIDRVMAHTLFDENIGGRYGNSHIALGRSFPQYCYAGDPATLSDEDLEASGWNIDTAVHTDFISRTDRTVTATLRDGSSRVIYADGQFQLD